MNSLDSIINFINEFMIKNDKKNFLKEIFHTIIDFNFFKFFFKLHNPRF